MRWPFRKLHATGNRAVAQHQSHKANRRRVMRGESMAPPRRSCNHEWIYMERQPGETYTGYCEQCLKCGEIVQVPQ